MRRIAFVLTGLLVVFGANNLMGYLFGSPPTAAADQFPWESQLTSLSELLSHGTPTPVLIVLALWVMVILMFSESPSEAPALLGPAPEKEGRDELGLLRRVREWLAGLKLPVEARQRADSIAQHLDWIGRQLSRHDQTTGASTEESLRKLLTVELPELVQRYQRIPQVRKLVPALSVTAVELLVKGLASVDDRLRVIHEHLVETDFKSLAVQSRYLELKYEGNAERATPQRRNSLQSAAQPPSAAPASVGKTAVGASSMSVAEPNDVDLMALGLVAVALNVDSAIAETPRAAEAYAGNGGSFGGAGAAGDWSDSGVESAQDDAHAGLESPMSDDGNDHDND